jgi:hypothetical protein
MFHTLGSIPVYGEDTAVFDHGESIVPVEGSAAQCCVPAQKTHRLRLPAQNDRE